MEGFEGETRSEKAWGNMQVCYGDSEAMEYLLIQLPKIMRDFYML